MYCSKCGSKLKNGSTFCGMCGSIACTSSANNTKHSAEFDELYSKMIEAENLLFQHILSLQEVVGQLGSSLPDFVESSVLTRLCSETAKLVKCMEKINPLAVELKKEYHETTEQHGSLLLSAEGIKHWLGEVILAVTNVRSLIDSYKEDAFAQEQEKLLGKIESSCKSLSEQLNALDKMFGNEDRNRRYSITIDSDLSRSMPSKSPCANRPSSGRASCAPAVWGKKGAPKRGLKEWFKSRFGKKDEDEIVESLQLPQWASVPDVLETDADCDGEFDAAFSCDTVVLTESNELQMESVEISEVQFSAVVQKRAEKEEYIPVDVIMYEDDFRHIVEERLDEETKEKRSGYHSVEHLSEIRVVLSSKDVEIDDCEEKGIWQGKYLEFGFVVMVPESHTKKQALIRATVYVNDLIATRLNFTVDIENTNEQMVDVSRTDITEAFVSYSSHDRNRVAAIVQGMQKARPDMHVFFDVESLRSGQKWEEALTAEIDRCNVFFLCWSKSASESKWVDFEWRYALRQKGDESIEPIPIEPPELCPPPEELNGKHFNDKLVYMIKALEYMHGKTACISRKNGHESKTCITKDRFLIGKMEASVDYLISNPKVSRIHAEIVRENGDYFIIDLESTNKTYVDNVQCISGQKTPLTDGALIKIADEEILFSLV